MNSFIDSVATLDEQAKAMAMQRQNILTKPPGALGGMENIAVHLAAMQAVERPVINNVWISVFAADHGIAEEAVSAFPQAVTAEMIKNFARGGAAINVLAKQLQASLEVINLGTVTPVNIEGVRSEIIAKGTKNFAQQPAMTHEQCQQAMESGRDSVRRALQHDTHIYIGGEMGIANTTSATAIASVLLDIKPEKLAGPGTGLDANGVSHKARVIDQAIQQHINSLHTPLDCLITLGGFEIAALTGAYQTCAQKGLPVMIDGFISTTAALLAEHMNPGCKQWFFFSHNSAEPGHEKMLDTLEAKPLLDLGMRLGEGSGAATAIPLIQLACALHNNMATFAEAQVSEQST